jgi:arabinose-5-phosphate isomerase
MLLYSGETEETKKVLLVLRKMKIKVMMMTGKIKIQIWQNSSIERESCPYNLVPTSLAMKGMFFGACYFKFEIF